ASEMHGVAPTPGRALARDVDVAAARLLAGARTGPCRDEHQRASANRRRAEVARRRVDGRIELARLGPRIADALAVRNPNVVRILAIRRKEQAQAVGRLDRTAVVHVRLAYAAVSLPDDLGFTPLRCERPAVHLETPALRRRRARADRPDGHHGRCSRDHLATHRCFSSLSVGYLD